MNSTRLRLVAMCAAVSAVAGGSARVLPPSDRVPLATDQEHDPLHHQDAFAQLDASRASHVAGRSGDWSIIKFADTRRW